MNTYSLVLQTIVCIITVARFIIDIIKYYHK